MTGLILRALSWRYRGVLYARWVFQLGLGSIGKLDNIDQWALDDVGQLDLEGGGKLNVHSVDLLAYS